jgi:predicted DsbA family dithiol-disulfide isomerase
MKIEIWSDVMCPFCYIGKRRFEKALELFPLKDKITIEWKSFQLSPDMQTDTSKNINQFLAEHKGISIEEAQSMNSYVTDMAAKEGLTYNFDTAIVANSFNAHRFTHFAKKYGKQLEAEEQLFQSYFTDGKNIDDYSTLIDLGTTIGLDSSTLKTALENNSYATEVKTDIAEAQAIGVRGVPFFVFNRKYAISGAQETSTFLKALEQSFTEWQSI